MEECGLSVGLSCAVSDGSFQQRQQDILFHPLHAEWWARG